MLVTNYPIYNEQKAERDKYPLDSLEVGNAFFYHTAEYSLAIIPTHIPYGISQQITDIIDCAWNIWFKGECGADLFDISLEDITIHPQDDYTITEWMEAFARQYTVRVKAFVY